MSGLAAITNKGCINVKNSVVLAMMVCLLTLLVACSKPSQPAPPSGQAQPAQSSTPAPSQAAQPAASGAKRYELVKEQSKASYVVTELLAGATVRNQAIGSTSNVTGELVLDAQGKIQPATFTVDLKSLTSDRGPRDNYIRNNGLESNRYPTATFSIKEVKGSPTFKAGAQETFEIMGPMKVRETERAVTWQVTSSVQDGNIRWNAVLNTKLTDWGINPPVLLVRSVAEVDDPFKIEVTLAFKPAN